MHADALPARPAPVQRQSRARRHARTAQVLALQKGRERGARAEQLARQASTHRTQAKKSPGCTALHFSLALLSLSCRPPSSCGSSALARPLAGQQPPLWGAAAQPRQAAMSRPPSFSACLALSGPALHEARRLLTYGTSSLRGSFRCRTVSAASTCPFALRPSPQPFQVGRGGGFPSRLSDSLAPPHSGLRKQAPLLRAWSRPICTHARTDTALPPPAFPAFRPSLRWGSQSLAPVLLRPRLPFSMQVSGLPPQTWTASQTSCMSLPGSSAGLPPPPARPTPRSLSRQAVDTSGAPGMAPCLQQTLSGLCGTPPCLSRRSCPLRPRHAGSATTTKVLVASKREELRQLFFFILHRIEHDCSLHAQLASSRHFAEHLSRLLAPFSVGTLRQYLNACLNFTNFWAMRKSAGLPLDVSFVADFLLAALASKEEDRDVHKGSPIMCIKALRWLSEIIAWHDLQQVLGSSVVLAYGKQVVPKDKKEATPIPMALLAAWERAVCSPNTRLSTRLVLGTVLACVRARRLPTRGVVLHPAQRARIACNSICD